VSQDFWSAQASGPGTQQLVWTPADGNWMLVVMNADGSANVSVRAAVGATVPALTGLAWGVLAGGVVLVAIATVLLVVALRRPAPSYPQPPYGAAPGYGPPVPPPSWAPPSPTDRTTAADARPSPSTTNRPPSGPASG
jgi:hypothetical protein